MSSRDWKQESVHTGGNQIEKRRRKNKKDFKIKKEMNICDI